MCLRQAWNPPLKVHQIQSISLTPFTVFSNTKGKKIPSLLLTQISESSICPNITIALRSVSLQESCNYCVLATGILPCSPITDANTSDIKAERIGLMPCIAGFLWWLQGIRRYFAISSPEASGLVRWFTVHMVTFIVWFIPHCASCPSPIFYLSWPFPRTFIQNWNICLFLAFPSGVKRMRNRLMSLTLPDRQKDLQHPTDLGFYVSPHL